MTVRSALIVGAAPLAGEAAHYARLIGESDVLIAADGGLLLCLDAGRVPDMCVGDFDSTPLEALRRAESLGAEVRRYPTSKDLSDLDLALEAARERRCDPIVLTAAFAGRLDHTLAALGTLAGAADVHAEAVEPGWRAIALAADSRATCDLHESPGTIVSVFAVGGAATVSAHGFRYEMRDTRLDPLSSNGLSNVATLTAQRIDVGSGGALVIVNGPTGLSTLQSSLAGTDTL